MWPCLETLGVVGTGFKCRKQRYFYKDNKDRRGAVGRIVTKAGMVCCSDSLSSDRRLDLTITVNLSEVEFYPPVILTSKMCPFGAVLAGEGDRVQALAVNVAA